MFSKSLSFTVIDVKKTNMEKIVCVLLGLAVGANGILFEDQTNRITAGNFAVAQQFPYMVSIQQLSLLPSQVQAHRCGGAMVTLQHALTAAQCTYSINVNLSVTAIAASQFRVFAGDVLLTNDNVAERIRTIANYTVHPEHLIYPALLHDIAVITLTSPFLNTTVVPIPLSTNNFIPEDFTLCSLAGWGAPNTTVTASNELRYATKYTYKHELCTNIYNSMSGVINIHPSMLCATSYDIYSVGCTGDEGNALVCNGQLTGILSLTNRCVVSLSYPEVYTRVSNYTTWVRSITGAASNFKPELALFALAAMIWAQILS